ncbi:TIGR03435 family protein [Granulicella sp. 5B5]|uniref:TIGR03435 family protein n=1 Tax=Granulicella sp. 5B5 TaxID=1617967 RepID=UPI0015F4DE1C|nr:TIGR03435 family protein [Granulicella sp. 5B5]
MFRHLLRGVVVWTMVVGSCSLSAQVTAFEAATVRACPPSADPATGSWGPPGHDRFVANHVTLERLVMIAYGVDASQVANEPGWFSANLYDVNAKAQDGAKLTGDEIKTCLQGLLHERFHLEAHAEMRKQRGYALVVAKGGPKLTPTKGEHWPGFRIDVEGGNMKGSNWTMPYLARMLTKPAGFPVVDQTGISGSYDVSFVFAADPDADASLPSLTVAIHKALGLELKPGRVPVQTIVIDSVDKMPVEN